MGLRKCWTRQLLLIRISDLFRWNGSYVDNCSGGDDTSNQIGKGNDNLCGVVGRPDTLEGREWTAQKGSVGKNYDEAVWTRAEACGGAAASLGEGMWAWAVVKMRMAKAPEKRWESGILASSSVNHYNCAYTKCLTEQLISEEMALVGVPYTWQIYVSSLCLFFLMELCRLMHVWKEASGLFLGENSSSLLQEVEAKIRRIYEDQLNLKSVSWHYHTWSLFRMMGEEGRHGWTSEFSSTEICYCVKSGFQMLTTVLPL